MNRQLLEIRQTGEFQIYHSAFNQFANRLASSRQVRRWFSLPAHAVERLVQREEERRRALLVLIQVGLHHILGDAPAEQFVYDALYFRVVVCELRGSWLRTVLHADLLGHGQGRFRLLVRAPVVLVLLVFDYIPYSLSEENLLSQMGVLVRLPARAQRREAAVVQLAVPDVKPEQEIKHVDKRPIQDRADPGYLGPARRGLLDYRARGWVCVAEAQEAEFYVRVVAEILDALLEPSSGVDGGVEVVLLVSPHKELGDFAKLWVVVDDEAHEVLSEESVRLLTALSRLD